MDIPVITRFAKIIMKNERILKKTNEDAYTRSMFRREGYKAFTLIEVSVVIAVMAILLSLSTFNLLNFQDNSAVDTTIETLVSDIKQQQLKSMNGATDGNANPAAYGIYLQTASYTLFTGATYVSTDPLNFAITLNNTLQITTTIPQSTLIFTKGSGEVQGFTVGQNTITVRHVPSNIAHTITINKYGTITNIN
ncbi:hypothetical protein BH09PAT2_BH09PAT2_05230 [soil metagenome]